MKSFTSDLPYHSYLDVALEAAHRAGELIRRARYQRHQIAKKGRINLVTEVDKASEELIFSTLQRYYPEHTILGEEQGQTTKRSSPYRWIVDPLDGTTTFAQNYPCFAVSIALEFEGRVIVGVVYDPCQDESFYATLGGGAYLNGHPIEVSQTDNLEDSLLVAGFPYNLNSAPEINLAIFRDMILQARGVRRDGSAAIDLAYIACGRFDAYWELGLSPWDVAAGRLLVQEAGGIISDFWGQEHLLHYRDILATNRPLHPVLLEAVRPYLNSLRHSPYWVERQPQLAARPA